MCDRTKIGVIKGLFDHKFLLRWNRHVLQSMEVFLIDDLYSTVVIGIDSWITPTGRKIPKKRRRCEKELVLPSMNRRWKTSDERKVFPRIEEPPSSGLWMRSKDEESTEKRKTRFDRQQPTQQSKIDYQLDLVRCQLSRAKTIIIQDILDNLRNRKSKIHPKIFDIKSHLV